MSKANLIENASKKVLPQFDGGNPVPPQVLIGVGVIFLRPLYILMNKMEEAKKRLASAARIFITEVIALPIALGIAIGAGKAGGKLCLKKGNKGGIKTISETLGFVAANIIIPPIATVALHKLPIKEKLANVGGIKENKPVPTGKPAFTSMAKPQQASIPKVNIYNNKNQIPQQSRLTPNFSPYSSTLRL